MVKDALSRLYKEKAQLKALKVQKENIISEIRKRYESDERVRSFLAVLRDTEQPMNKKTAIYMNNYLLRDGLLFWHGRKVQNTLGGRKRTCSVPSISTGDEWLVIFKSLFELESTGS